MIIIIVAAECCWILKSKRFTSFVKEEKHNDCSTLPLFDDCFTSRKQMFLLTHTLQQFTKAIGMLLGF